jgi:hypothetical protein
MPGYYQQLNYSKTIKTRSQSAMDISIKINEHRRRKSENLKKIIKKINEVKIFLIIYIKQKYFIN